MAASQNAKTLAYRSISKAAVFLFSYNLSFNPRTMFCVKGKKSFSAISKKNRTTFGRNFTLRNTRLQAVILQAYHAVITLDPGLNCSKGHLKTPAKVHQNFFFLFFFYFSLFVCHDSVFEVTPILFHHCGILYKVPIFLFQKWDANSVILNIWHILLFRKRNGVSESTSITSSKESENKKFQDLICPLSRFN